MLFSDNNLRKIKEMLVELQTKQSEIKEKKNLLTDRRPSEQVKMNN
jgi:hypothetical protein